MRTFRSLAASLALGSTLAVGASAALLPAAAQTPPSTVPPSTTTAPLGGTFSMLTYNVAGLPEGLSGSNPSVNTPLISPLLNDYDVVIVQEDWVDPVPPIPGFDFHHDDLISAVTHPYLSEPATPPLGTVPDRPSALVADGLNQLSRLPFADLNRVRWVNCFGSIDQSDGGAADCLSLKGFTHSILELAPGVEVDLYNLHAEAGSTPLDLQYSAEDFEQLAAYIGEHSAGRPLLIGGDFNLHTDEDVDGAVFDEFIAATGITDTCAVVDCGDDADEIDKIGFRSGGGVTLEALTHRFERDVFVRDDGAPLSDHDALAVTIRWQAPAPTTTTTAPSTTTTAVTTTTTAAATATPRFTG